jgi:hypothetical protein
MRQLHQRGDLLTDTASRMFVVDLFELQRYVRVCS